MAYGPLPFDASQAIVERMMHNVEKVISGKRQSIELVFVGLLAGGHILLEDVPGTGKTILARAVAKTIGAEFKRIQLTPDLMPSDVTGVSVWNPKSGEFEFRAGPIMAQVVLADELNRTTPKTQAALLEAMEERSVTVDGTTRPLPLPFVLLATQNPVESEGTFPLPEAQLDRFLLRVSLGYPELGAEMEMLSRVGETVGSHPADRLRAVIVPEELLQLQREAAAVHVDDSVKEFIVRLAAATRQAPDIALGASPRASLALMRAAQARGWMRGRSYVIPDDVKDVAVPVLAHRLMPSIEARIAGRGVQGALIRLLESVPVPALKFAPHSAAAGS